MARFPSFGSGLSTGFVQGSQVRQNDERLGLQRQQLAAKELQNATTRIDTLATNTIDSLSQQITSLQERGIDPRSEQGQAIILPQVQATVETLQKARGAGLPVQSPELFQRRVTGILQSAPSREEQIQGEAQRAGAVTRAQQEATPPTLQDVPAFSPTLAERTGGDGQFQAVFNPRTAEFSRRTIDENGNTVLIPAPDDTRQVGTQITGTRDQTLGRRPTSDEAQEAGEEARDATGRVVQLQSLLSQITEAGRGATGVRGFIGENIGGLLAQANERLGEAFTEGVTGLSGEELAALRSNAQRAIAASIPETTGEESGRFTEQERRIASQTLAVRQPGASFAQVKGALQAAASFAVLNQDKKRQIAGIDPEFDMTNQEDVVKFANQLGQQGYSRQAAADLIQLLQAQRRALSQMGADELRQQFGEPDDGGT